MSSNAVWNPSSVCPLMLSRLTTSLCSRGLAVPFRGHWIGARDHLIAAAMQAMRAPRSGTDRRRGAELRRKTDVVPHDDARSRMHTYTPDQGSQHPQADR